MNQNFNYDQQNEPIPFWQYNCCEMPFQKGHSKGFSIASLCLGIASVICCCCCLYFFSLPLSVISIVFSCLAKRDNGKKMPGMAIAGLILAILGLLIFLCIIAFEITILSMDDAELREMLDEVFEKVYGMNLEEYFREIEFETIE